MSYRDIERIEKLRADQAILREAADVVRAAPAARWAALSEPRYTEPLASMLDKAAERLEHFPDFDRRHWVRVASDLCGRRMERPTVRRTRR